MQLRGDLIQNVIDVFRLEDGAAREQAIARVREQLAIAGSGAPKGLPRGELTPADVKVLGTRQLPIDDLPDRDVAEFNMLLPWAAKTLDHSARSVGSAWSDKKRNAVHALVDQRHTAFNAVYPLVGRHILEVGCFEAIHTLSCLSFGARVTGVDSRVANILKSIARLWAYGAQADIRLWDLERSEKPATVPPLWDMLHHIGVLYHLSNPVEHLHEILARTKEAVLLDTHVAREEQAVETAEYAGHVYRYFRYGEHPISPFAGMKDHAKWLLIEDLVAIIRRSGFADVRVVEQREERNGRRVTLWAFRDKR